MSDEQPASGRKTPAQYQQLAQNLDAGMSKKAAMVQAGWSEGQSKKGKIPRAVYALMQTNSKHLIKLGRSITPADQESLVRGKLVDNVNTGKDQSVQSAKLLGQDRRVNMFTPEQLTGIIVLQPPYMTPEQREKALQEPDE